jgi:hypothetical protein
MVKQDINFSLTSYSMPTLSDVDNSLVANSQSFGSGDNFELASYSMPSLSAVNFALSIIGAIIEYFGILKRWTGASWVKAKLKVYNGALFAAKTTKRWDGAAWKEIDVTGV